MTRTKLMVPVLLFAACGFAVSPSPRAAAAAAPAAPTFSKDVAPILFNHCVTCHRPGEVAPFTLTTYADAKKRARQIAEVVDTRYMPPWKAEPGHGDFAGVRRLTDGQISTLKAWAAQGAPEGDPKEVPPLPKFIDGWQLGEPDLVVTMTEPFTVPAEGSDVYRCFVMPIDIPEDKYVAAVEFRPSNRKVVHHTLLFLDASGAARRLDAADDGPGYEKVGGPGFTPTGGLGGWAPGVSPHFLPDGVARPLKKGSDLVMHTHFHPSGKPEVEQSSVGLYFAKKLPEKVVLPMPKAIRRLDIPPGEKKYEVSDTFTVPVDVELAGIVPHAHLLCKEIKVDATLPGGEKLPLIWIKDWDWDWQEHYNYAKTMTIPAGTEVSMYFRYDNSADNPKNPSNPPRRVTWGEQTRDEMAIVFFQILLPRGLDPTAFAGGLRRGGRGGGGAFRDMVLKRFDKNGDGKLDDGERREALKAAGGGGAR